MEATTQRSLTETKNSLMVGGNIFDTTTPEGRMAARAYAFMVAAEGDESTKRAILRVVGRDDG